MDSPYSLDTPEPDNKDPELFDLPDIEGTAADQSPTPLDQVNNINLERYILGLERMLNIYFHKLEPKLGRTAEDILELKAEAKADISTFIGQEVSDSDNRSDLEQKCNGVLKMTLELMKDPDLRPILADGELLGILLKYSNPRFE